MAVNIDSASAKINIVNSGAVTAASVNQGANDTAVANLTKNFNSDPTQVGFAFELFGRVKVSGHTGTTVAGFKFGFIQFIRHTFTGIFYAGRKKREGAITVLVHPAITTDYMVDVFGSGTVPFQLAPVNEVTSGEVIAQLGDHPVLSVRQQQHNFKTGEENFLFHMLDVRDAWSIFTVQDDTGAFRHLAHVRWFLRYDFKFQWRNGTVQMSQNGSSFRFDPVVQGPPTDPLLTGLLGSLGPSMTPLANTKANQALKQSLVHPNANRKDLEERFVNVPNDFFQ